MALTSKKEIVDEIAYELWSGMPSADRSISDNFILRKLNDRIAEAAVKSAFGSYNLDGCVCADDIFRLTYTGITIGVDTVSGYYFFQLPAQPIGIPGERSFELYAPGNRRGVRSGLFKMIARSEVQSVGALPGMRKVYCFVDNGNMCLIDNFQIMPTYPTINMSVISSGANDLTAFLNLPDDMIAQVKTLILTDLRQMLGMQDSTPLPSQDSPQPR